MVLYNLLLGLQVSEMFENGEKFLNVRDGSLIPILTLGIVELIFKYCHCYYYPLFMMNVIFVGLLTKDDYHSLIKKDYYDIIMNNITIIHGQ